MTVNENHTRPATTARRAAAVKVVVTGGFSVGKTTLVGTAADSIPVTTEVPMTPSSTETDELAAAWAKDTTTAAMDFGRVPLSADLVLYVFGTPGLDRFVLMRDTLVTGATGAVVLADPARIADCFATIDCFEQRRVPYVVAVNAFDHSQVHTDAELRDALQISADVPMQRIDARRRLDVRDVLTLLMQHALSTRRTPAAVLTQP